MLGTTGEYQFSSQSNILKEVRDVEVGDTLPTVSQQARIETGTLTLEPV